VRRDVYIYIYVYREGPTVAIAIVGGNFLANMDGPEDTKGDVPAFAKELAVVVTVML